MTPIENFLKSESAGGILLMFVTLLAMLFVNFGFDAQYESLISTPFQVKVGGLDINKPILLWINDGLMAIFFFLVGLELKRELIEGELKEIKNVIFPAIGAIGGMLGPALIYVAFNWEDPVALKGWAIPAATDIAFALGVLSLLGSRVPLTLKVFLTSLAIFDDIGAIIIIALFYTSKISLVSLLIAGVCIPLLAFLNKRGVVKLVPYFLIGIVLWTAMLKSGVHATLAGVILALFIPMRDPKNPKYSPVSHLEHFLHKPVAFIVLPIFAFTNSGINFTQLNSEQLLHGVPLGIALGLFVGKQIGIMGLTWAAVKLKWCELPKGMNWGSMYGTAILCGIGFTMSLFIGSLAFEETGVNLLFDERIGIVAGSLISGLFGYFILKMSLKKPSS